jgi:DtxR family manganese transport transcriptional regulator
VAEDYVELIHRLGREGAVRTSDLATALGVAQPTVTKALDRLEREGLVVVNPRRSVELTEAGSLMAREAEQRHSLIVGFLEAIGVPRAVAELDAEGIEHHVSESTQRAMKSFLKQRRAS